MKHLKAYNSLGDESYWAKTAREAKEKKELQKRFPFLGKKVRRKGRAKWEEGIVVLDSFDSEEDQEQFIEFSKGDREQLDGLPFQVWDENSQSWKDE